MILFRCWKCHRKYTKADDRVGEQFVCGGCQNTIRVPKKSDGNSRVRTLGDWLIEVVVCGGGGAVLGGGLGLFIVSRAQFMIVQAGWGIIAGLALFGFLLGALGGVRGLDLIGSII